MYKIPRISLSCTLSTRARGVAPAWGFYHYRPNKVSTGGTGVSLPFIHISCHWGWNV